MLIQKRSIGCSVLAFERSKFLIYNRIIFEVQSTAKNIKNASVIKEYMIWLEHSTFIVIKLLYYLLLLFRRHLFRREGRVRHLGGPDTLNSSCVCLLVALCSKIFDSDLISHVLVFGNATPEYHYLVPWYTLKISQCG